MNEPSDTTQIDKFLKELKYPLGNDELIQYAKAKEMPKELISSLETLPDAVYASPDEVKEMMDEDSDIDELDLI